MKKISVLLIVLVMILSTTMNLCAKEVPDIEHSGSITFSMTYAQKPMDGGSLTVYRVGTIIKKIDAFEFMLIESLGESGLTLDHLNDATLVEKLMNLVYEKKLDGFSSPIENGKVVFHNLKPGLYLVTQRTEETTEGFYPVNPFLISLPTWENGQYVYDLMGEPKNLPQHKPGDPDEPNEPREPEEPHSPDGVTETLPQTGQLNWPIPLMISGGVLLFVIGCRLYWGRSSVRKQIGLFCMVSGAVLFFGALSLFLYNEVQSIRAEQSAKEALMQMVEQAAQSKDLEETENKGFSDMTEMSIDGYTYVGYLSIPELELELPIMADWDYVRLKIAPCRYSGSVREDNLVLIAHNYEGHFGLLSELKEGAQVIFTDVEGESAFYHVAAKDVLVPTAVEEITGSDFDLALFTCTYGGKSRIVIYCEKKP